MCNADHAFISAKWWARVVLAMMWWPIDPIFNYSSSSEDRDERRTTSTSLKKSGSGKENNKPESASSKNSRSQGFGLPVNNVNAGSNLMSNLPTRTSSKPKATPTKIGTINSEYSALCSRNFQNVKLRLEFVEVWSFYRHSDFGWNHILVNSNSQ